MDSNYKARLPYDLIRDNVAEMKVTSPALKGLTHLGKSCQIYPNVCQNFEDALLNMFIFFLKKYCVLCQMLRFKVFGLVTLFEPKKKKKNVYRYIYGGRLLLVIALVIATC